MFTAVVVLPTPPFWFAMTRVRRCVGSGSTRLGVSRGTSRSSGVSTLTASSSSSPPPGRDGVLRPFGPIWLVVVDERVYVRTCTDPRCARRSTPPASRRTGVTAQVRSPPWWWTRPPPPRYGWILSPLPENQVPLT